MYQRITWLRDFDRTPRTAHLRIVATTDRSLIVKGRDGWKFPIDRDAVVSTPEGAQR